MTIRARGDRVPANGIGHRLRRAMRPAWFGTLRRTTPIGVHWGYDRGRPVDRYYIDGFLERNRTDVRGRVLEVKEPLYTARYGSNVDRVDILDHNPDNALATVVADITRLDAVPSDTFDCCIVTQTLQYVYDAPAAIRELHRVLRPGGVLLVSVPAITRLDPGSPDPDYWRFTIDSCNRLFGDVFQRGRVEVEGHGNVLASVAFLEGLAQEELTRRELDANDWRFHLVIVVRAVKAGAA